MGSADSLYVEKAGVGVTQKARILELTKGYDVMKRIVTLTAFAAFVVFSGTAFAGSTAGSGGSAHGWARAWGSDPVAFNVIY